MLTTNKELQRAALALVREEPGCTLVVPSGRFGRLLRHLHRLAQRREGRQAWESPRCLTVRQLLEELWQQSWPDETPAPRLLRLRLLHEATRATPPPAGLLVGPDLLEELDDSFDALMADLVDPGRASAPALCAWRAGLARPFREALRQRGAFHPAELGQRVAGLLTHGPSLKASVGLVGLSAPARAEARALEALRRCARVRELPLPIASLEKSGAEPAVRIRAVTLPDRQQELLWLGEELVEAARRGTALHLVGVVLPDLPEYQGPLRRLLEELLGENDEHRSFWNLALADPLASHPLVRAGLAPLRVALTPDRELVLELLLSSYYGAWREHRNQLARADRVWRERGTAGTLADFAAELRRNEPRLHELLAVEGRPLEELLAPLSVGGSRPVERWLSSLQTVWTALDYPVLGGERDQTAQRRWQGVLDELSRDLGSLRVGLGELLSWIEVALRGQRSGEAGEELAGVQVVGLTESRGLSFERVLVPGVTARCLPQPVRELPLLSREERRLVRGGTAASQLQFAQMTFGNILSCADEVWLSRPAQADGETLPPSPLWPVAIEEQRSYSLWGRPSPAWLRTGWVRRAWQARGEAPPCRREPPVAGLRPKRVPVTALALLFECPFKFLALQLLGLEELPEPMPGIRPQERGTVLHRILADFVQQVIARRLDLQRDRGRVEKTLEQAVSRALAHRAGDPLWDLERRRLLGDAVPSRRGSQGRASRSRGLLRVWLELERERWAEGWRFVASEVSFRGRLGEALPFDISGRIDRIDSHPQRGEQCWDYKTGVLPSWEAVTGSFTQPQLLAYLAAVRRGLVLGSGAVPTSAGYLGLRSEGELEARGRMAPDEWAPVLDSFLQQLGDRGRDVSAGELPARPLPGSADRRAAVRAQCGRCGCGLLCWEVAEREGG